MQLEHLGTRQFATSRQRIIPFWAIVCSFGSSTACARGDDESEEVVRLSDLLRDRVVDDGWQTSLTNVNWWQASLIVTRIVGWCGCPIPLSLFVGFNRGTCIIFFIISGWWVVVLGYLGRKRNEFVFSAAVHIALWISTRWNILCPEWVLFSVFPIAPTQLDSRSCSICTHLFGIAHYLSPVPQW